MEHYLKKICLEEFLKISLSFLSFPKGSFCCYIGPKTLIVIRIPKRTHRLFLLCFSLTVTSLIAHRFLPILKRRVYYKDPLDPCCS